MTAGGNSFKNATAHKVKSYYTLAISYCTFCVGKHTILGPATRLHLIRWRRYKYSYNETVMLSEQLGRNSTTYSFPINTAYYLQYDEYELVSNNIDGQTAFLANRLFSVKSCVSINQSLFRATSNSELRFAITANSRLRICKMVRMLISGHDFLFNVLVLWQINLSFLGGDYAMDI